MAQLNKWLVAGGGVRSGGGDDWGRALLARAHPAGGAGVSRSDRAF